MERGYSYICYKTVSCDKDGLILDRLSSRVHSLSSQDERSSLCPQTGTSSDPSVETESQRGHTGNPDTSGACWDLELTQHI